MGPPKYETAPGLATESGISKGLAAFGTYPTFTFSAMDFAIATIARRCHLPAPTARVVVELAQLGGQRS
jgi:hypothetical protein